MRPSSSSPFKVFLSYLYEASPCFPLVGCAAGALALASTDSWHAAFIGFLIGTGGAALFAIGAYPSLVEAALSPSGTFGTERRRGHPEASTSPADGDGGPCAFSDIRHSPPLMAPLAGINPSTGFTVDGGVGGFDQAGTAFGEDATAASFGSSSDIMGSGS